MSLVSTDWLEKNLKKVKLIDCSWHLPNSKRDPYKEYIDGHIPNAIFFDLDKIQIKTLIYLICCQTKIHGKKFYLQWEFPMKIT